MSILNQNQQPVKTEAEIKAEQIKDHTNAFTNQLIRNWNIGWGLLWDSENPQEIIDQLGTDAAELFELNDQILNFLIPALTGKRDDQLQQVLGRVAEKPETTVNGDGTVSINENINN